MNLEGYECTLCGTMANELFHFGYDNESGFFRDDNPETTSFHICNVCLSGMIETSVSDLKEIQSKKVFENWSIEVRDDLERLQDVEWLEDL